ncbi:hypothetical protein ACVIM5_006463 [Bradyrhizobium sp. USDA 4512]
MEGRRHHREGALQRLARQAGELAPVGKARGVHDAVDRPERGPRCRDQRGAGAGLGEIAGADLDPCALAAAFLRNRIQPREADGGGALSVQHQGLSGAGEPARDCGADAGAASGDDRNSHEVRAVSAIRDSEL